MTTTATKERPIIMQAESVRAILDGRKSVTRRVMNPQPMGYDPYWNAETDRWEFCDDQDDDPLHFHHCPYGTPGDVLWVKEAYRLPVGHDKSTPSEYVQQLSAYVKPICYEANREAHFQVGYVPEWGRYRHARFMPRVLSRLMLDVVDVRVERLQDISYNDCLKEGISEVQFRPDDGFPLCDGYMIGPDDGKTSLAAEPTDVFAELWNSINAARGFGWESNCWVWVVEFKPVEATP